MENENEVYMLRSEVEHLKTQLLETREQLAVERTKLSLLQDLDALKKALQEAIAAQSTVSFQAIAIGFRNKAIEADEYARKHWLDNAWHYQKIEEARAATFRTCAQVLELLRPETPLVTMPETQPGAPLKKIR